MLSLAKEIPENKQMKHIDLDKNLKESDSKVLKKMPAFFVSFLKKVVKQEEINSILNKYIDNNGVEFVNNIINEFNLKPEISGVENLPENGKCFFVANHPFGIVDGLILTSTISEKYGKFKAIGNDAFMLIPQMREVTAAVNVYGQSSRAYVLEFNKIYSSDFPITHFPAGMVSRWRDGKVQDFDWQKSVITKAVSHKRDIVPFYFYGSNSKLFHSIYRIRKFFGIKATIELALLPHELFNKKNKTIKAVIGKPIPWQKFDKSKSPWDWAQELRKHIYKLKDGKLSF
ncbi:MAG: hypothetical protein B6I20_13910 [Bacteroidetes bacterium 4572_117]|nr:MAG: hypothetical protein B6I20_13910 [Bacteroidetes bacterium 4572_117]